MTLDATQYEMVDPATLRAAPYNPRRISPRNLDRLADGIREFGFLQAVVVNTRTGYIVGGHQRVQAAIKLGLGEVPVTYINVDEARERALNVRLNNPNVQGEFDMDMLKDLLEELDTGDFDMHLTGYDEGDIERLLTAAPPPPEPAGGGDPVDGDGVDRIKTGDRVLLGEQVGGHVLEVGENIESAEHIIERWEGYSGLKAIILGRAPAKPDTSGKPPATPAGQKPGNGGRKKK